MQPTQTKLNGCTKWLIRTRRYVTPTSFISMMHTKRAPWKNGPALLKTHCAMRTKFIFWTAPYSNSQWADRLFGAFPYKKVKLDISEENWASYEDKMLSFLGIERMKGPDGIPPSGTYRNEELNSEIKVDGMTMTDPTGNTRELIAKSSNEFYVKRLPVVLRFEADRIITTGMQICERWTATGTVYRRIL